MAQWTNINRNNRFVNPLPLSWMTKVSGAVHLALPGLMVGRQAGRQAGEGRKAGRQIRRNAGEFRKFENSL